MRLLTGDIGALLALLVIVAFFTVALTGEYDSLGVTFAGPGGFDGGAILDECSGFGISGYSPPNFLAFNTPIAIAMQNTAIERSSTRYRESTTPFENVAI